MNYIQIIEFRKVWILQRYLYIALFLVGILSQSFNVSSKDTHDFSYSTLRIDARLEDEGSRGISIHTNICAYDLKLGGKWLGQHCLRAKVSKKIGKAQNHDLVLDSNKLKSFSLETSDYDEKNGKYKFWLRPQANDDTQNFNKFIKKLSPENAAVIGFLCKKIVDEEWFDKSLIESWRFANYRKSKEIFQTDAAIRGFQKIANRCYSSVEKRAGVILVTNTKEANSNNQNELCGYSLVDTGQLGKNERVELQSALSALGLYRGNLDGAFGENSCNALRAFIKIKTPPNLQASTKYLGKKMLSELLNDAQQKEKLQQSATSSNLVATEESDTNEEKTKLCGYDLIGIEKFGKDRKIDMQMALSVLEIYSGAIDGDFGKKSCKALKEFIKRKTPSYLLSSKTTFSRNELQLLLTYARELKPDIKYVLGPKIATSKKQEAQPAKVAADNSLIQQMEQIKADNEVLAIENSELNKEIDSRNVIISELKAKLSDINAQLESAESKLEFAETKSEKLKSLIAEQDKLSIALEEKMMTLETKSVSLNTKLIQAEQTVVAQTNEIDELKIKNTELSDTVLSLKDKQSEFSTYKTTSEKLIADLELEKNTLLDKQQELKSVNEKYKDENESLDKKLKKVTSKALLEGGLSGKLSSSEDAKQETNDSSSNSLGANMISKKILDNLRNEISELKKDNSEQANLIGKLKGEIQQAESKLATSNSEIHNLKNDIKKQVQDIKALNEELEIATLNAEKNVNEISSLKSELTELKEYRASVIDEKAQEIENSKAALQQLLVDKKALVISSQTSEIEVLKYIDDLNNELGLSPEADTFDIFLSQDKVYAITLGIGTTDECNAMRDQLLSFDSIPEESFCSDWDGYVASFDVLDGKMIPTVGRDFFRATAESITDAESTELAVNNTNKLVEKSTTVTDTSNSAQTAKQANSSDFNEQTMQNSVSTQTKNATKKGTFSEEMLAQFGGWYSDKLVQLNDDQFVHCLSMLRILRAESLFYSGKYYEDVMMALLTIQEIEKNRRGFTDKMLAPYISQYLEKFKSVIPDDTARFKALSMQLVTQCGGTQIADF